MPIGAGRFRDRVRIQERTLTRISTGEIEDWSDRETRYARVIPFMVVPIRLRSDYVIYEQQQAVGSYVVDFIGNVSLHLSNTRIIWEDKILIPIRQESRRGGSGYRFTQVYCHEDPDSEFPEVS